GEPLIYVQPLYLRAEGGRIPEMKRVVVAHQNRVVMEETLDAGLARLFGGAVEPAAAAAAPTGAARPGNGRAADLARRAAELYQRAVAAQRRLGPLRRRAVPAGRGAAPTAGRLRRPPALVVIGGQAVARL